MVSKKDENGSASRPVASAAQTGFQEIATESLRDKVISSLKNAFFSGQLKPGDAIVERQLAQQMKIGSPAIREALITLQEQGFVQRVANTGTYVNNFSIEETRQLYQIRIELEALAFKWAKLHVKEEDLAALGQYVELMVAAAKKKNVREFFEHDLAFHRYLWRLSGNKYLERSLENLVPPLFAFVLNCSDYYTAEVSVARQHLQIISALKTESDPEFSSVIRGILNTFALDGISSIAEGRTRRR